MYEPDDLRALVKHLVGLKEVLQDAGKAHIWETLEPLVKFLQATYY